MIPVVTLLLEGTHPNASRSLPGAKMNIYFKDKWNLWPDPYAVGLFA